MTPVTDEDIRDFLEGYFEDSSTYRMAKELQQRREAERWIPVTERLPEKYDYYYLVVAISRIAGTHVCRALFTNYGWESYDYQITHWRPLPKPPEDG